ncbi:hypothetical protein GCM10011498_35390 [Amylibacter cionae]|uniref:Uncharacterized protein n=1 Tax=Neptunicoccus cionae TaxID=2035344 RepID=A0A916R6B3_9RHOB|nr:hypothetical protein GCM10011498_35390 [Amylibacter cionae]
MKIGMSKATLRGKDLRFGLDGRTGRIATRMAPKQALFTENARFRNVSANKPLTTASIKVMPPDAKKLNIKTHSVTVNAIVGINADNRHARSRSFGAVNMARGGPCAAKVCAGISNGARGGI